MRRRSLRLRLALTYAGMALLTALILGGILLGVLAQYYSRSESAYLNASAKLIAADPPPLTDQAALDSWAKTAALSTQTHVRLYDSGGALLADSGSPGALDAGSLLRYGQGRGYGRHSGFRLPDLLGSGLFGGSGNARSSRTLTVPLAQGRHAQLSEAPASGHAALVSAAEAWIVAATLAVALAALAGYLVAARIARPVVSLTEASDRMAEGDLSARASVDRADEVGRLADSFNAMAGRMETTVDTLRRFVGDAAHEIGTPLTALEADLDLAERAATTDKERGLVQRALGQASRLDALSTSLLQLSRLEAGGASADASGGTPNNAGPEDVAALAREAAGIVASRAEQAGVELRLDISAGPLPVGARRTELQMVLGNLLDNAVKFTPEGGSVRLSAQRDGDTVVLAVADTGVGIPEAEQDGVFGRFHRARNVAAYPGNGLGLAIVKAAVERNHGSVTLASSDAGTEFRVTLPLA